MPTIRKTNAIAANGSVANLLTGERYEFATGPTLFRIFASQDGADDGTVKLTTFAGNVIDLDAVDIPRVAAGIGPNTNEHGIGQMIARASDRLQVKLENNDAVNIANVRVMIQIAT